MGRLKILAAFGIWFYAGYLRGLYDGETDRTDRDCGCEDEQVYPIRLEEPMFVVKDPEPEAAIEQYPAQLVPVPIVPPSLCATCGEVADWAKLSTGQGWVAYCDTHVPLRDFVPDGYAKVTPDPYPWQAKEN